MIVRRNYQPSAGVLEATRPPRGGSNVAPPPALEARLAARDRQWVEAIAGALALLGIDPPALEAAIAAPAAAVNAAIAPLGRRLAELEAERQVDNSTRRQVEPEPTWRRRTPETGHASICLCERCNPTRAIPRPWPRT